MTANIASLLEEMGQAQLIIRYRESSNVLIQIRNWWAYQSMQWAYPSKYPPPEGWVDHLRYRKGGKVITNNWPPETESESLAVASDKGLEDIAAQLSQSYEKEIGVISPTIASELADFAQYYRERDAPMEWIKEAFAVAARNNKRSWAYVKKVLTNQIEQGEGGQHAGREQPGWGTGTHREDTGKGDRQAGFHAIESGPEQDDRDEG